MNDQDKTKEQLIAELVELRQRVGGLGLPLARTRQMETDQQEINSRLGVDRDITEREQAEVGVRQRDDHLAWLARLPEENPGPVLCISHGDRLLYANRAARAAFPHWPLEEGQPVAPKLAELSRRAVAEGQQTETELNCDQRFFWVTACPKDDGVNLYAYDITDRKRADAAVLESRSLLEREKEVLQSVMDGTKNSHLVYLDRDFNFVRVNETYAKTCGYTPEDMIGKNHFVLYPHEENEAVFARVRDTGVGVELHDNPFVFPDQPERGITYWDWTLCPVKDGTGHVVGLVFSLVETTARKQVEAQLRASKEQFELVVQGADVGIWDYDIRAGKVYYSPPLEKPIRLRGTRDRRQSGRLGAVASSRGA